MKHKILLRWLTSYLFAGSVFALVMVTFVNPKLESIIRARFEKMWTKDLSLVGQLIQSYDLKTSSFQEVDRLADQIGAILGVQVTLMSFDGRILGDSKIDLSDRSPLENQLYQPAIIAAHAGGLGKFYRRNSILELAHIVPFDGDGDSVRGFVQLSIPTTDIDEALFEIHSMLWLAGSLGLILILLSGYWISRSFSTRVAGMTHTINDLHSIVLDQMKKKKSE